MVAVVVILQVIMGLLQSPAVHFCHSFQFRLEVLSDFFFCDAADGSIFWKKTDIGQVVEYREKRNLRKLGNTRNEDETLVCIIGFQNGKNASIYFCTTLMLGILFHALAQSESTSGTKGFMAWHKVFQRQKQLKQFFNKL